MEARAKAWDCKSGDGVLSKSKGILVLCVWLEESCNFLPWRGQGLGEPLESWMRAGSRLVGELLGSSGDVYKVGVTT